MDTELAWITDSGKPQTLADRHPATQGLMRWLTPNPNLPPGPRAIANQIHALALNMLKGIDDGPELSAGLRKLLEAKDCLARAYMDGSL